MAIPASAARRRPVLGPALLLALTLALLLGGWIALSPATVDAQNMSPYGRWYAKVGGTAICPAYNDIEADAGAYSRLSANTITLNFKEWEIENCGPGNVDQLRWGTRGSDYTEGALYSGRWYLELRTGTGSGGQLIQGAYIDLPDSFSGRRTSGLHNRRDQTTDGDWPNGEVHWGFRVPSMHPVTISFSVPDSHGGPVYLHAGAYFNEQEDNNDVWEDFTFKFDPPPSDACVGPLQRHVQRIGLPQNSYQVIQITDIHDCDGSARTTRTTSRVPVDRIPRDIPRPHADCNLIKSGITSDYQRNTDDSLHVAGQRGGRSAYAFQLRWADQGCGGGTATPGTAIGVTTCGGGILSQTPIILQRRITADNRIAYQVDLRHQLSGQELDFSCPYWFLNLLWTHDVPETITAP